jgi:hypothetical protein
MAMTTENINHSLNTFPFLSEKMERTLRLRAWKDEIFREALISDPKGVIQRLFPQCFPNGKLPEELTIKVIEEDPDTCHIVLPPLPDEIPTLEIPEEEQLELVANMGLLEGMKHSEKLNSQHSEKREHDFTKGAYKRKQETASRPLTKEKIESLARQESEFRQKLLEAGKETSPEKQREQLIKTLKEHFPHSFDDSNIPEKQIFKVIEDTEDTHTVVLQKLPDTPHDPAVPENKQPEGIRDEARATVQWWCSERSCTKCIKCGF